MFFSAGPAKASRALLRAARAEIARRLDMIDDDAWAFVWIVDPPLFEPAGDAAAAGDVAVGSGAWTAVHHAFTAPSPNTRCRRHRPGSVLADAYDIVCNGHDEIGGGSIRIHRRDVQEKVFAVMGIDHAEADEVRVPVGPSPLVPRRTAVSPLAGTASPRCCSAPTRSVTSSRSPSPAAVWIR